MFGDGERRTAREAIEEMDTRYQHRPELRPNASHLAWRGHKLLRTRYGRLDVLGSIGESRTYEDLLPHTRHAGGNPAATGVMAALAAAGGRTTSRCG